MSSAILASRGFACLALAYFKYDDLPETLDKLELDYFEEAVDIVLARPEVIPDRCGVVSSSKGSDLALAMSIHLDKVKAVVTIGGLLAKLMTTLTYKNKELWHGHKMDDITMVDEEGRMVWKKSAAQELYQPGNPLMVPCETAPQDTYFLLISGDQDTCHSKYGVEAMAQRLRAHGREAQCRTIIYPGAGHIIEPPYNTSSDHSSYDLAGDQSSKGRTHLVIYWGGEPRAACHAQEDYWNQIRDFLNLHARDRSTWYQEYLLRSLTDNNE